MKITHTEIPGLVLIEPEVHGDARGFFFESYNAGEFRKHGLNHVFVQDNHSMSVQAGVLRGLHYQLNPRAQTKLVRVTAGAVFDVVLDIRKGSPTYGKWQSFILSAENKLQLLVPKGCAHGFCTLEPNTEVQYKVDEFYSPEHDRGIAWNDPALGIDWPCKDPILSEKDRKHPPMAVAENNFVFGG
jgi:dTDP-4-dehydrorhamnose 3,5-epimerase